MILAVLCLPSVVTAQERFSWKRKASVHYSGTPLRESLHRLAELQQVAIVLDRQIDPSLPVVFEATDRDLDDLLTELAESLGLGCYCFEQNVYIGPRESALILPLLLERHRKALDALPLRSRSKWLKKVDLEIPFLGEPRTIVTELSDRHDFLWKDPKRLPHDLWPENTLKKMPLYELMSLLLIGFELDYSLQSRSGKETLEIVPIPEAVRKETRLSTRRKSVSRTRQAPAEQERKASAAPLERRRFTLQVEQQRLDAVVGMLADRLDLEIQWDEASLESKGIARDHRVSFDVKNATAAELFQAILGPLDLDFQWEKNSIRIR